LIHAHQVANIEFRRFWQFWQFWQFFMTLHITNGESVTGTFQQVRLPGSYLAWNDALHDGPVPQTGTLNELSDVRAQALAAFGWGDYEELRAGFARRDRALEAFRGNQDVVLWFEHDLYDQLQLLQLLDWFAQQDLGAVNLDLIQINSYPGVVPFYGLGQLTGPQLSRLFPSRKRVSAGQMAIAREAWRAFRAGDPAALLAFTRQEPAEMPYLKAALLRLLEEYPWTTDGLSRTERQILNAAAAGCRRREHIYMESRKQEDVPWGDLSVYLRIGGLARGPNPALVEGPQNEFALTDSGHELAEGKADWIRLSGGIDRWLGGAHLTGAEPQWRWDPDKKTLHNA
jgi:hypothetical protein